MSESNLREHWTKKHTRQRKLKSDILIYLNLLLKPQLPVKLVLTRIAPRSFDEDNLWSAMKIPIDVLSNWLIPGLQHGRADGDKRIEIICKQKKGRAREYSLLVEIFR